MLAQRLGAYEILAKLGHGGMGEVYRARDTKLGREVAIKVLPPEFVSDGERVARFQREAQVLAALNHPHIAQIYGFEDAGDVRALVMELVDGETLDARLARGALPVDEALAIARQIAEALEAAHEKGIVHRDLKPSNIALTKDGQVKVLDFGLAKLAAPEAGVPSSLSMSPTITSPALVTGVGVLLGTAAYMSPEQAKGREADKRSDVWAFGCVLYEMLTGTRAFDAEDVPDTLAAVLTKPLDWSGLPANTPASIRHLLRRCVHRDTRRRLRDVREARIAIEDAIAEPAGVPPLGTIAPRSRVTAISWLVALSSLLLTASVLSGVLRRPDVARPTMRLTLDLGERVTLDASGSLDLSRDGTRLAFIATSADGGASHVYLRDLAASTSVVLSGTDDAKAVFFSPDDQWVGFVANGRLKKVRVAGGAPVDIRDVPTDSPRAAWADDGTILFGTAGPGGGIRRIGLAGTVAPVTTVNPKAGEINHRWPSPLPRSSGVLFTASVGQYSQTNVFVQPPSGSPKVLVHNASSARYVAGHLIYEQGGALYAAPFSLDRLEVSGTAVPLLDDVAVDTGTPAVYAVSATGTLVAVPGAISVGSENVIDWMDRAGRFEPLVNKPGKYVSMQFSPDGRTLAVDPLGALNDVWLFDVPRASLSRFTFDPAEDRNPVWSPDGRYIAFASRRATGIGAEVWVARADASGEPQRLTTCGCGAIPNSWHPSGQYLALTESNVGNVDVGIVGVNLSSSGPSGVTATGQPQPFASTPFREEYAAFSRDGHWLAYQSDESGTSEIFVRPFPGPGPKVQVSTSGGSAPAWAPDGRHLLYSGADHRVWSAEFAVANGEFRVDKAVHWSEATIEDRTAPRGRNFDVSPRGDRLAVLKRPGSRDQAITRLLIVTNVLGTGGQ